MADQFEAQLIERLKSEYPENTQIVFKRYRKEEKHRPHAAYINLPYMGTVEFPLMSQVFGINLICGYLRLDIQNFILKMTNNLLDAGHELGKGI